MLEQDQEESLRAINEAVMTLTSLTKVLHDHHRDAFDWTLSDLLRFLQRNPSAINYAHQLLIEEFKIPHNPLWQVTQQEYERRKLQVLLAVRQVNEHHSTMQASGAVTKS